MGPQFPRGLTVRQRWAGIGIGIKEIPFDACSPLSCRVLVGLESELTSTMVDFLESSFFAVLFPVFFRSSTPLTKA